VRVYLPYADSGLTEWTRRWAFHYCPSAIPVHTPGEYTYAQTVKAWWEQGDPFIVVEHDVIPWPGALGQLASCPHPWCAYAYGVGGDDITADTFVRYGSVPMGCFKVEPRRLGRCPFSDEPVHWTAIDSVLAQVLYENGHRVHQHWPSICNLNGKLL
jgi:hypothetical protein